MQFRPVLYFLVLLILGGCKKDDKALGVEVQPGSDLLNASYLSNLPVAAHTVRADSTISLNTAVKYLGSIQDQQSGATDIGLYLNANMLVNDMNFGTAPVVKSAEIALAISIFDFIGDIGAPLTFSVFTLDSSLSATRAYYTTNNRLHKKTAPIAVYTGTYQTRNGVPVIVIPIDLAYATTIVNNPQYLTSNATFQQQYKGFYIAASRTTGEGLLLRADLDNNESGFRINYKNNEDTSATFRFAFNGNASAKFNTVAFTPAPDLLQQLNGDTTLAANKLVLKGLGLTRLKVRIPFLKQMDTFNVAVNRAEVIFSLHPSVSLGSGYYPAPPKLALLPLDAQGREIASLDQRNSTDMSRYSGVYDAANRQYVFNIPRHAQSVLKGETGNYGFHLVVADPQYPFTIRRDEFFQSVLLAGTASTGLQPRMNLSYVKIN